MCWDMQIFSAKTRDFFGLALDPLESEQEETDL